MKYKIFNRTFRLDKRDADYNKTLYFDVPEGFHMKTYTIRPSQLIYMELSDIPISLRKLRMKGLITILQVTDDEYYNELDKHNKIIMENKKKKKQSKNDVKTNKKNTTKKQENTNKKSKVNNSVNVTDENINDDNTTSTTKKTTKRTTSSTKNSTKTNTKNATKKDTGDFNLSNGY